MTKTARELAKELIEQARLDSIRYGYNRATVNYPYMVGYLSVTVEDLLRHMTPKQRAAIAKLYRIS